MPTPLVFELTCSPEQAFNGFTDGSEIIRWWGDPAVYRTISWKADLRDGGAWRVEFETPDGSRFGAGGAYVVIDRPSRLDWTWTADWEPQVEKTISMTFLPAANGTAMTVAN